jgi:hypothetical protein
MRRMLFGLGIFLLFTPSGLYAQDAIVTQDAPIYVLPDARRQPLRTAAPSTRLRVVEEQGEWLRVEFQDPQFGKRVGYIESKYVQISRPELQPMDLSVRPTTAPETARVVDAPQQPVYQLEHPAQPGLQRPKDVLTRDGKWFSLGMGLGSLCNDGCLRGFSGGLSFGTTINPHVVLGVGTTGYYREYFGNTLTTGTVDARVRVYPWLSSGFFVTGGFGLGTATVSDDTELGYGFLPGAGWDFRVGKNVSLTPYYNWFLIRGNGLSVNVEQLGLAFTIH